MFEKRFLRLVDTTREPIKRTLQIMVRLKAPDYSTPNRERKEYIYYRERWEGVDWRGIPVNPVDLIRWEFIPSSLHGHTLMTKLVKLTYNDVRPNKGTTYLLYSI